MVGLDTDEGGVVCGCRAKEISFGYRLGFKRTKLLGEWRGEGERRGGEGIQGRRKRSE